MVTPDMVLFTRFCEAKLGVNGPDVHMKVAGKHPDLGLPWLAMYNSFCSTAPAAVLHARDGLLTTEDFLRENWAGIPVRKNRRPVRAPHRLAHNFETLAVWMINRSGELQKQSYQEAWDSLDDVWSWGRYVKIKFLESCRRFLGPEHDHLVAPDIRPAGGWSPRKAIALIYPQYQEVLTNKKAGRETLATVNGIAAELHDRLEDELVRSVSFYEMEALLCNFRQAWSGTFYPGRTIDSEYEYHHIVEAHWGDDPYLGTFNMWKARAAALPWETLGERNGWIGVRKDLFPLMRDEGIVWTDKEMVYEEMGR